MDLKTTPWILFREAKGKIRNLIIVNNKRNMGKGYSVKRGILKAKGRYIIFFDADNSAPIENLEKFYPFLGSIDIIIGSRAKRGSILDPPQPLYRRLLRKTIKLTRMLILGLREIEDTQCGFKLFSSKSAKEIFSKIEINSWMFDVEAFSYRKRIKV